jgi:hypothetical protein
MQSMKKDSTRAENPTTWGSFKLIVQTSSVKGLYRGVLSRIGVATRATIRMVGFGDMVKEMVNSK